MGLAININLGRAANAGEIVVKQKKEYIYIVMKMTFLIRLLN